MLPRVHGSAVFSRGETQALCTITLGTSADEQMVDGLIPEYAQKFFLHYNFPSYSVGEVRPIRGPGRREIGHGALAERSLLAVLPPVDQFPYTVRIISDILESNGSSSMASSCGGDARPDGRRRANHQAGGPGSASAWSRRATGRNSSPTSSARRTTSATWTSRSAAPATALPPFSSTSKIEGLDYKIIRETLHRAKAARLKILDVMEQTLAAPRKQISAFAPRLLTVKIDPERIGKLIGPGGKNIKALQADTNCNVDIEDDGTVYISSTDAAGAERCRDIIEAMTAEVKVGKIYNGRVVSIKDFGAFVEIAPETDGLCHVSELSDKYVAHVGDVVHMGDEIKVKVLLVDDQGRIKLSRKAAMLELGETDPEPPPRPEGGDRGPDRGPPPRDRGPRR